MNDEIAKCAGNISHIFMRKSHCGKNGEKLRNNKNFKYAIDRICGRNFALDRRDCLSICLSVLKSVHN